LKSESFSASDMASSNLPGARPFRAEETPGPPARQLRPGLQDEVDGQQDAEEAEERRETLVEPGVAAGGAVALRERPEEGPVLARRDEDRESPGED
jgi:hypothetical protein